MDLNQKLSELGFDKNQIKIYLELLKIGATTTEPLIKNTQLHRQIVYNVLHKFEEEGLVTFILKGKKKIYQASNPEIILENQKQKASIAEQTVKELKKLSNSEKTEQTEIYSGKQGFKTVLFDVIEKLPKKGTLYIIGANTTEFYELTKYYYTHWNSAREKKQIKRKMISYQEQSKIFKKLEKNEKYRQTKYLDKEDKSATTIWIYGDRVALVTYVGAIRVVLIQSSHVAKSFRNYFNFLWKISKL